jgi:putative restriction endonuclease
MPKNVWSHEELILTFNLYLKLPFGKMHKHNPEIIALANLLGRTPSSIGMRLGNFASCDPHLQARGIGGLKGGMNQVKPIWEEYYNNQEEFVFMSEQLLAEREKSRLEIKYKDVLGDIENLEGRTAIRQVKVRINQSVFRTIVLNNFNTTCCVTGMNLPEVLVASHIVPWSVNEKERLNPRNGLCLNALHDKAFDKGYITITPDYKIKISQQLSLRESNNAMQELFLKYQNQPIHIPEKFTPSKEFLDYHNHSVFLK